jgi:hypothetical protein
MRRVLLIVLVCLAAAVVVAAGSASVSWNVEAKGFVKCQSGKHVVGIWIELHDYPGDGFAHWAHYGGPDGAHYWFRMHDHAKYGVHVGCGGTHQHWATNNKSPRTEWAKPDHRPHWLCLDQHETAHHKLHSCFRTDVGHPAR